jgi:hypothetical protein
MPPGPTVDEFVKAKVAPEFRPLVAAIRALVRECAPNAQELISYGMPVFKGNQIFAWINPPKKEVTFSFPRGVQLDDRYGLLRGTAPGGTKHVKMKKLEDLNKLALKDYIKQAVKLDKT